MDKEFKPGQVYRENRLIPGIIKGATSGLLSLTNSKRFIVKGKDYYCVLVDPKGNNAIFIDEAGDDVLVSREDFNSNMRYSNSAFKTKIVPKYVTRRGMKEKFKYRIEEFYSNKSNIRRYGKWTRDTGELLVPVAIKESRLDESQNKYLPGEMYTTDDGELTFIVEKKKGGTLTLLDVDTEESFKIGLAEIELMNPKFVTRVKEFEGGK